MHAFETLQRTHAQDIWIRLIAEPLKDQRRYNLPTAHKIATIIPGNEIVTFDNLEISYFTIKTELFHISATSIIPMLPYTMFFSFLMEHLAGHRHSFYVHVWTTLHPILLQPPGECLRSNSIHTIYIHGTLNFLSFIMAGVFSNNTYAMYGCRWTRTGCVGLKTTN